jgi:predicted transcriptional regulator
MGWSQTVTTNEVNNRGGTAAPVVIPTPAPGDERMDASGAAKFAWDVVAVFGPLTRVQSARYMPSIAWNTREYRRWNGREVSTSAADGWAWTRAIDQAISKGWITESDGLLTVGEIPPDHRPVSRLEMRDVSNWAARDVAKPDGMVPALGGRAGLGDDAVKFLRSAKWREVRRKPDRAKRAALKASIERIGVLYPILVWSPPMSDEEIVIDGITRQEIVAEINAGRPKDRRITMLDPIHLSDRSAYEVVLARIEAELHGTSKDQSDDAFVKYLAKLEGIGLSHRQIGEYVGMTQAAVAMRLSRAKDVQRTAPPERDPRDHTEEFVRLRDQGYYQVDIARITGWSQPTVSNVLSEYDAQQADEQPSEPRAKIKRRQPRKKSEKPKKPNAAERIQPQVAEAMDRAEEEGVEISGTALKDELGVSRIAVREAIAREQGFRAALGRPAPHCGTCTCDK